MSSGRLRKQRSLLFLVALMIPLATVVASSPARASYYEHGVSLSGEIVRDSIPYRLNVKAVETMGNNRLDVSLRALQDPAGPTKIRQTQRWSFILQEGELSTQDDTYRIDVGSAGSPLHADFIVERREDAHCSDGQQLFVTVPEGGGFHLDTANDVFETITELPACAKPWSFSSGPRPGPPPCPSPGQELWGSQLQLDERRWSDSARILMVDSEPVDVGGRLGTWSLELRGRVPASRFRLDRQLSGSFKGAELPWLDGVARFDPQSRFKRDRYDCRGKREALIAYRDGAITGNLTLDVIGSRKLRVSDSEAVASRSRVRR